MNLISAGSSDNVSEVHAQIEAASNALNNHIDILVIDARCHEPYGKDPIWDVPLSEWNQHHDAARIRQHKFLFEVKAFLQHQHQKLQNGKSLQPFAIVIIGYRTSFDSTLDQIVTKLQRDISWLHAGASVSFLDVDIATVEASEQLIAAAIGILVSNQIKGSITSIDTLWRADASYPKTNPPVAVDMDESSQLIVRIPLDNQRPKCKIALSFDFDAL